MRQIRYSLEAQGNESWAHGVESVLYIRCMKHRDSLQLNEAEIGGAECGECVRQELSEALEYLLEAIPKQTNDADWWPDELTAAVRGAQKVLDKAVTR